MAADALLGGGWIDFDALVQNGWLDLLGHVSFVTLHVGLWIGHALSRTAFHHALDMAWSFGSYLHILGALICLPFCLPFCLFLTLLWTGPILVDLLERPDNFWTILILGAGLLGMVVYSVGTVPLIFGAVGMVVQAAVFLFVYYSCVWYVRSVAREDKEE